MIQVLSPKKQSNQSRGDGRSSRGRAKSPNDLREFAQELKNAAATFEALAAVMDKQNLKSVNVDGETMAKRGFEHLRNFASHITKRLMNDTDLMLELLMKQR